MEPYRSHDELHNMTRDALERIRNADRASPEEVAEFFHKLGEDAEFVERVRLSIKLKALQGKWHEYIHIPTPPRILRGLSSDNRSVLDELFQKIAGVRITETEKCIEGTTCSALWVTVMWG